MKNIKMMKKLTSTILGFSVAAAVIGCNVEKKQDGALPDIDVDIDAEAGRLPSYDVDWADVNVGTRTETVSVPKVVVVMEEEEIEVPYVDVDMPDSDSEKEELTLEVEAEVEGKEHKIDIKEIVATNKNLYVFAKLEALDQDLGDQKMRVSDRIIMNAPDDLNVKYIIEGEKPNRVFNNRYKYISDREAFKSKLENSKVIFTK